MRKNANSRNTGVGKRTLAFLTSNSDRLLTSQEIADGTGDVPSSIANALAAIVRTYPNARRPQKGIYIWDSAPKAAPSPNEFIVKVLKRKDDGSMLVQEDDNGSIYVMKPVEF